MNNDNIAEVCIKLNWNTAFDLLKVDRIITKPFLPDIVPVSSKPTLNKSLQAKNMVRNINAMSEYAQCLCSKQNQKKIQQNQAKLSNLHYIQNLRKQN